MAELSRIVVIVSAGFSALVLFLSLRKASKEVRVRPGLEWARVGVGVGGVLIMGVIVGTQTPVPLAVGAVFVGATIGFFQGQQIVVTLRDSQLWAQRTVWGIALFSAGLVAMQLAGLSSRTGLFRFGQAVSYFSIAVGIGLIAGRSKPELAPAESEPEWLQQ